MEISVSVSWDRSAGFDLYNLVYNVPLNLCVMCLDFICFHVFE